MTLSLPPKIEAYFAASNAARPQDLAAVFAPDGEVRDERETHRGPEAIIAWARHAQARYAMQSTPLSVDRSGEAYVVRARVTGDFPGSPLDLAHRFEVSSDGVRRLEIGG